LRQLQKQDVDVYGVILRRKVLPSGICTRSVRPASAGCPLAILSIQFLMYSPFVLVW